MDKTTYLQEAETQRLYRVHEHLFGQKFKPLESNDDSDEFRGLLERLTTTLDFLFSAFVFLLKRNLYDDLELKNIFIQRKKPVKTYQQTNRT
jgi:hypothetical protein